MAFREDRDLEFLSELESKDLDTLVEVITKDPKDGKLWFSESLTKNPNFKKYFPDHIKYWKDIAEEIQYWGANSIISLVRKQGVLYQEIAKDVASKVKADIKGLSSTEEIEQAILLKLLSNSLDKMSVEERKKFVQETNLVSLSNFSSESITLALQLLFKAGGVKSFQLTGLISSAVLNAIIGKSVVWAGNTVAARGLAILTGPIGLTITSLWTIFDLAGPAYRVTIPTVVQIAFLRQYYKNMLINEVNAQL